MHPLGRFMIASSALPLAAPAIPPAAPALLSAWAALHAAFMWTLLRPGGTLLAPNIQRGPSEGSRVALTFDDGPRGDHTRWLLDRLGEAGIPGTFFAVGERARKDKEVIRRIVSEGHTLGNHTQTHPASWALAGSPGDPGRDRGPAPCLVPSAHGTQERLSEGGPGSSRPSPGDLVCPLPGHRPAGARSGDPPGSVPRRSGRDHSPS
jgi:hypothetical protein